MVLFSAVGDDYRFELIREASDFEPLRQALLINPMIIMDNNSYQNSPESVFIDACNLLLEHPNYVLLEMDYNFFTCPFKLAHRLLEICPPNPIVVMSALGFVKRSHYLEPMNRYTEFFFAEENRFIEKINQKRYLSTLKSDIKRMYNIPLGTLIYIFAMLLVGYLVGSLSLMIEYWNGRTIEEFRKLLVGTHKIPFGTLIYVFSMRLVGYLAGSITLTIKYWNGRQIDN